MTAKNLWFMLFGAAGFTIIAYFVKNYDSLPLDSYIDDRVYTLRGAIPTGLFFIITFLGSWQTISIICLAALFFKKTRKQYGYVLALAAILSSVMHRTLKEIFVRERPEEAIRLIHETGFSYPSGHSVTALVFYGLIIYFINTQMNNKRAAKVMTALLGILIVLIGVSRVYLGVHYPTDVMGGFCIGTAFLFFLLFCKDVHDSSVKKNAL